jgi:hypothetical protein
MKIFPLTIYVLLKSFIQILPSDSKKSLWDSRTTATLASRDFPLIPELVLGNPVSTFPTRILLYKLNNMDTLF